MRYKEFLLKKKDELKEKIKCIKKESLYCIAAGFLFAILSFFLNKNSIYIRPYEIKRGAYGTEKASYKVRLDAENLEDNLEFSIQVSPKRYIKEEADNKFKEKFEKLLIEILGENEDFEHIYEKLNFKIDLSDGIKADYVFEPYYDERVASISEATNSEAKDFIYYTKYQNVIDGYGNVKNENFTITEKCSGYIVVQLSTNIKDKDGAYKSEKYMIPVIIISKKLNEIESFKKSFSKEVVENDQKTINEDNIHLPKTVNNYRIKYKDKPNYSFLFMPVFGFLVAILLEAKEKEKKKEEEKNRKRRLELDFSQIISKILLYVSSGMTVRNSMIRLATDYQNKLKKSEIEKRIAYDEIVVVKNKLNSGYGEARAYEEMAKNIGLRTYTRFLNIVIQSIKNGNKDLKNVLNMEVQDALYERKQRAKKLGEEASTKLVLPLMMMLSVIMIVIIVPAFMGM